MDFLKLALFTFFCLFVSGYVLVKPLAKKNFFLNFFLSISLSLVIISLFGFIGGILDFRWLVWVVLGICNLIFWYKKYYMDLGKISNIKYQVSSIMVILLILIGVVFQNVTTFRSGKMYDFGIGYWGPTGRDGVWHQTLVNQLIKKVPPENPGFANTTLSGYHYFYDLLVAQTHKIVDVSVEDLIYRFYPILFSLLFGIGTYFLSDALFKNKLTNIFSLFFAFFGSSFGWIVEFIRERHFGGESAFWMNQPVSMNLNPPFAASMVLLIAIIILFQEFQKQKSWRVVLPLVLITGVLAEFKVYAGLIAIGALIFISLEALFAKKDSSYLKLSIPALFVFIIFYFLKGVRGTGFIELKPLWLVHSAIDFPDRVGWMRLSSARINYYLAGNWPKFFLAEVLALVIFIAGNLGTRIIGLPIALRVWKENLFSLGQYCFVFWLSLISFIIPFFFVQKGNPWNTIQFGYYFLYFSSLFAGYNLAKIISLKYKLFAFSFSLLVLTITPISSLTTFTFGLYPDPPAKLTKPEYQALSDLKEQPEGIVLTFPYDKNLRGRFVNPYPLVVYDDTDYVSAYSGKAVFLGDIVQQGIFLNDFNSRLKDSKMFFAGQLGNEFLEENNIKYIYLPKIYGIDFKIKGELVKIFENNEALIISNHRI